MCRRAGVLAWVAFGWIAGMAPMVAAQAVAPGRAAAPAGVNALAEQLADQVRRLGEDVLTDMGRTDEGKQLLQDTQELAQSVEEFHRALGDRPDPSRLRQAYSGINDTWQHLRARMMSPGIRTQAVSEAARRVEAIDAQLQQALGLRSLPAEYYGEGPPPAGIIETRRLARSLDDRARSLNAAIRADMIATPIGNRVIQRSMDLARACDEYSDAIQRLDRPDLAQNLFAPVAAVANNLETELSVASTPPRVQSAWQGFASAEILIRQHLGLPTPPPAVTVNIISAGPGPSPVVTLSRTLLGQVDAFLDAFTPTAGNVPEGDQILADARRLRASVAEFARDAARVRTPAELAADFRAINWNWQRLARRINRVARGRTGPNIQQASRMGETIDQLHSLLAIPGYPPVLGPFDR